MVLDILINPKKAINAPLKMFGIGMIYALIGASLSYWVFRGYASIVMVSLISIVSVPLIHAVITQEEAKESKYFKEIRLLREHEKVIKTFLFLFLGFVTLFVLLYLLLPNATIISLFSSQIETILTINTNGISGNFISSLQSFSYILANNLKILLFCLMFAFFYGAGAIFILSWNASMMGVAIGNAIRVGFGAGTGYMVAISSGLFAYLLHGIPEIIAYFMVALAGGMISVAIIKEKFLSKTFRKTMMDSFFITLISIVVLVIAALLELYVSPLIL